MRAGQYFYNFDAAAALAAAAIPVPTLSEWGMLLLSGLLAFFGWRRARRRA